MINICISYTSSPKRQRCLYQLTMSVSWAYVKTMFARQTFADAFEFVAVCFALLQQEFDRTCQIYSGIFYAKYICGRHTLFNLMLALVVDLPNDGGPSQGIPWSTFPTRSSRRLVDIRRTLSCDLFHISAACEWDLVCPVLY